MLFVFETPGDEDAFMDAVSYVDHAPFASSNLETIAQHGILADTWPPPNSSDRLPLHRLGEGYKNVPSRSRRFL